MAKDDSSKNPFVSLGASLAGIFMVISVLFLIFARASLSYLVAIAWAFVVLGIALAFFTYLSAKTAQRKSK